MTQRLHTLPSRPRRPTRLPSARTGERLLPRGGSRRQPVMRADTDDSGDVREVATIVDNGAQNFHVRLSPDGSRVAFDSDRDGVRGVYVAAAMARTCAA